MSHRSLALLVALLTCAPVAQVHAETYPDKPVRLVISLAPGGGTDTVARRIAQRLGDVLVINA